MSKRPGVETRRNGNVLEIRVAREQHGTITLDRGRYHWRNAIGVTGSCQTEDQALLALGFVRREKRTELDKKT